MTGKCNTMSIVRYLEIVQKQDLHLAFSSRSDGLSKYYLVKLFSHGLFPKGDREQNTSRQINSMQLIRSVLLLAIHLNAQKNRLNSHL